MYIYTYVHIYIYICVYTRICKKGLQTDFETHQPTNLKLSLFWVSSDSSEKEPRFTD